MSFGSAIQIIAHVYQRTSKFAESSFCLAGPEREQNIPSSVWKLETASKHRLQQCFMLIFAKASNLTSAGHFYPKDRISTLEPSEGKHRRLHTTIILFVKVDV